MNERSVCVVHLIWAPLGLAPLRRFLAAYRENPGGIPHRLLMVYNGFKNDRERDAHRAELNSITHDELLLPQPVQDLTAYFIAAEASSEEYLCFLNSYSVMLDPLWLRKLLLAVNVADMGAVGATGSAESLITNVIASCFPVNSTFWSNPASYLILHARLAKGRLRYPAFPNYHLRTNGFLIRREHFLKIRRPLPDKRSAEQLESGRRGLTRYLYSQGLRVGVVGRDGVCYPPERWAQSRTFRSGEQQNLLIADNRTVQYAEADAPLRRTLSRFAWGKEEVV